MPSQQNYLNKYTIYIAINVSSIPTFLAFPLLVGVPSVLIVPEVTSIPNFPPESLAFLTFHSSSLFLNFPAFPLFLVFLVFPLPTWCSHYS